MVDANEHEQPELVGDTGGADAAAVSIPNSRSFSRNDRPEEPMGGTGDDIAGAQTSSDTESSAGSIFNLP